MSRPIMTAAELSRHRTAQYGRDYNESDDGYSDMEAEERRGWRSIAGWGRDGWDLGDWPFVVVYHREKGTSFQVMQICEGDRTVYDFTTVDDQHAAIDYLFVWYGARRGYDEWVAAGITENSRDALDAGTLRVPDFLRGAYSGART